MEKFSNKKIIISLLVIGVVVGGAIYIYRKNKKKTETSSTDTGTMTTEKDALEMADVLGKKDQNIPIIFMKKFVDLYTKNINKDLHKTLLVVASKKESEWTTQEKLDMSILINKVFLPLSTEMGVK
jgi:alpha-mannosidase